MVAGDVSAFGIAAMFKMVGGCLIALGETERGQHLLEDADAAQEQFDLDPELANVAMLKAAEAGLSIPGLG